MGAYPAWNRSSEHVSPPPPHNLCHDTLFANDMVLHGWPRAVSQTDRTARRFPNMLQRSCLWLRKLQRKAALRAASASDRADVPVCIWQLPRAAPRRGPPRPHGEPGPSAAGGVKKVDVVSSVRCRAVQEEGVKRHKQMRHEAAVPLFNHRHQLVNVASGSGSCSTCRNARDRALKRRPRRRHRDRRRQPQATAPVATSLTAPRA